MTYIPRSFASPCKDYAASCSLDKGTRLLTAEAGRDKAANERPAEINSLVCDIAQISQVLAPYGTVFP